MGSPDSQPTDSTTTTTTWAPPPPNYNPNTRVWPDPSKRVEAKQRQETREKSRAHRIGESLREALDFSGTKQVKKDMPPLESYKPIDKNSKEWDAYIRHRGRAYLNMGLGGRECAGGK